MRPPPTRTPALPATQHQLLALMVICLWWTPTAAVAIDEELQTPGVSAAEAGTAVEIQGSAPPDSSPVPLVEQLHERLLDVMMRAEELGYQGRFDLLRPALAESFDLDFMASKSVGRGWKTLGQAERKRWQEAFGNLITASFAGRFEGWTGQSFKTHGEESAAHETRMVLTTIIDPEGEDVDLNYRMQEKGERWRIIDVYFKGTVSELAMRRSEYSAVLKRDGFEELIQAVDRRIADLASGKVE